MPNDIEIQKQRMDALNKQLAELDAERKRVKKQLQVLCCSRTKDNTTGLRNRAMIATAGVLTAASLIYPSVFHDAQSSVQNNKASENSVISVLEPAKILRHEQPSASADKSSFISFTGTKTASQQQWGPLLVRPEADNKKHHAGFDSLVKTQQQDLLTLGFDIGKADGYKGQRTHHAIAEFRALYLPDTGSELTDTELAVIMENYANLARRDAARYGIDHGIVAAIRLSSLRTGVDFSYLMKLAATESNFEPGSKAATSSATGLYQFTRDTWLRTLKAHGVKYGIVADYAAKIDYYETRSGYQRPVVRDESIYQHLLELRKNPRLASMMAAETVRDHQQKLADSVNRTPTETDLYMAHFLGIDNAITFLQSLQQSPGIHAVELFPAAASSNRDIFHPRSCEPRTIDEVYALFDEKFSTRRYDDFAAN